MQWTVQEPMPALGNRMTNINKFSTTTAEAEYFAQNSGWLEDLCIRIVSADDLNTYTFGRAFTVPLPKQKK